MAVSATAQFLSFYLLLECYKTMFAGVTGLSSGLRPLLDQLRPKAGVVIEPSNNRPINSTHENHILSYSDSNYKTSTIDASNMTEKLDKLSEAKRIAQVRLL